MELPKAGKTWKEVRETLIARGEGDANWREDRTAVYVFNTRPEIAEVQREAYALYMSENGLGPLAFPSLAQMEQEVIRMDLSIPNGPTDAAGAMTSRFTDSITMAMKAARDFARAAKGLTMAGNIAPCPAPWKASGGGPHRMKQSLKGLLDPMKAAGLIAEPFSTHLNFKHIRLHKQRAGEQVTRSE